MQGFNQRLFGVNNNPNCPAENTTLVPGQPEPFTPGRNYWHDANNQLDGYTFAQDNPLPTRGNRLRDDDPRLVTLFFTPYDSFAAPGTRSFRSSRSGTSTSPVMAARSGAEDRGREGRRKTPAPTETSPTRSTGCLSASATSLRRTSISADGDTWVWGHFVDDVKPNAATSGGTGIICNPGASFQPCVAVLVE